VVVERRAEAVQKGDAAEPRAGTCGGIGVPGATCHSAQHSLDLVEEDLREGGDGLGPVGKHAAQSLRQGDHPLPHGHRRDDVIGEVGGGLGHVAAVGRQQPAGQGGVRPRGGDPP
jgi:hypothetical protein